MRTLLFILVLGIGQMFAQSAKDSAAVRTAAKDYAEGWYTGDVVRMERALHPMMVRRIVGFSRDIRKNENVLGELNAVQMLDGAAKGIGKRIPEEERISEVTILSMYTNTASVRLEMANAFEFLHLGRWNGEWKIINILWEMKPQN